MTQNIKMFKICLLVFVSSLKINIVSSAPPTPTTAPTAYGRIPYNDNIPYNNERVYAVSKGTNETNYRFTSLEIKDNMIDLRDISNVKITVLFLLKLYDLKNPLQNLTTYNFAIVSNIFQKDDKAPQKTSQVIDGCSVLVNDNFNYGEDYINRLIQIAIRLIRATEADHPQNEEEIKFFYFFDYFSHGLDKNLDTKILNSQSNLTVKRYFNYVNAGSIHIQQYINNDQSNYEAEIKKLAANIEEKNNKIKELKKDIKTLDNYDREINKADGFFKKAWGKIKLFFFKIKLWFKYNKYERNAINSLINK